MILPPQTSFLLRTREARRLCGFPKQQGCREHQDFVAANFNHLTKPHEKTTPSKKTQVPEPSRESKWKTGSAKHCPKPRFLFISRRISGTVKASDPFHALPFGKAAQSSRYTLTAPGLSCSDIIIHPLFCNVKLVLPNFSFFS